MGIYPEYQRTPEAPVSDQAGDGVVTWTETRKTPGLVEHRTVYATGWEVLHRDTCYCCSCGEQTDPYCRNHNFGFGMRPCEKHGMTGQTISNPETYVDTGEMPASVQECRRRRLRPVGSNQ